MTHLHKYEKAWESILATKTGVLLWLAWQQDPITFGSHLGTKGQKLKLSTCQNSFCHDPTN